MHAQTKKMRLGVYWINFLLSLAGAITLFINSSFLESVITIQMIGVLYAVSAAISILLLTQAPRQLSSIGNRLFFTRYGIVYILSLLCIIIPISKQIQIAACIAFLAVTNVLLFSINIFFERIAKHGNQGKMRGIFLLLGNVGVMTGPIVSAYAISIAGFTGAYIFGLGIFIVLLFSVLHDFKKYEDASYKETHIYSAVLATMKEKTLTSVVSANFILQFFYVWMVVYTPIYLAHYLHFSWETIGLIFTVMLSTFVVLDYPLGKLADWLKSEKEFTAIGFLIMVLSVFALAYVNTPSALVVGIILFCSRVGAATVEAMTEIHFFRITKESNPGLLALFSDIRPLAYILAPILGTIVLNFLPIQHIFTVLGIILLFGFCISFYMEKHKEWWVENH